jgi:hypothetical protein
VVRAHIAAVPRPVVMITAARWVGCRSNIVVPRWIVSADRPMSMNSPAHADERTFQSGFAEAPLIPWLDDP